MNFIESTIGNIHKALTHKSGILPLVLFFAYLFYVFTQTEKPKTFLKDLQKPGVLLNILVVASLSIYYLSWKPKSEEYRKMRHAVKQAIVALIIAVFAHMDVIFAPFYLVLLFSLYAEGWT